MSKPKPEPTAVTIKLRQRFPLIGMGFLLAAAILLPDRAWNTLLAGLGGLYLLAYGWTRWLIHNLRAERRLHFNWVAVGDQLEEHFVVANHSPVPALWVEVSDGSNVPGYAAAVVRSVSAHTADRWRQSAVCERRGQYHLGPWSIRSGDPFGLFVGRRAYAAQTEIIIHPPIHGRLPIPLPTGTSSGRMRARQPLWQATANAATVRHYHPHDPHRWIHWPTSARRDALLVRQFEQDAAGDIWLMLDLAAEVQVRQGMDSAALPDKIERLSQLYTRRQYSPQKSGGEDEAVRCWRQLRLPLQFLRIVTVIYDEKRKEIAVRNTFLWDNL